MGNVFMSDSVAYVRLDCQFNRLFNPQFVHIMLLECQFNYVFKPPFVHVMLLECQFNSKFKPQVCACYFARLLIQLGIQTTDWVRFSGKSVLCNDNVFMSDSMVCSICRLSSQFNYVFKPWFIV